MTLSDLEKDGIQVTARGGEIVLRGPVSRLTAEQRDQLARNKPQLLTMIRKRDIEIESEKEKKEFRAWIPQFAAKYEGPLSILAADLCAGKIPAIPYDYSTARERWEGCNFAQEVYAAIKQYWLTPCDETRQHAEAFAEMWQEMQPRQERN